MDGLIDLYRQTRTAQGKAERGGLIGTATALGAIVEMLVVEAGVGLEATAEFGSGPAAPPGGPFPVLRYLPSSAVLGVPG